MRSRFTKTKRTSEVQVASKKEILAIGSSSKTRLGIISDVHGNIVPLETVLKELKNRGVRDLVCLGDAIEGGPAPSAVLKTLSQNSIPVVAGNADEEVLSAEGPRKYASEFHQKLHDVDRWSLAKLSSSDIEYMRSFKPTVELPLPENNKLLCFHGSPRSNREGIFPSTSEEELARMLEGTSSSILACGHTHVQMFKRFIRSKVVINPGSVGSPYDFDTVENFKVKNAYNPSFAEYAILEYSSDSTMSVELCRCHVDINEIVRSVVESDMPHVQTWIHDLREIS